MSIIDDYKSGKITLEELKKHADKDPLLAKEVAEHFAGKQLSDDELEEITGAGIVVNTDAVWSSH